MRIKSSALGIIVLVTMFGGIALTSALNVWNTTTTKVPVTYQEGNFKGQYDPSDIRGSYTLQDIKNTFNVPVKVLGQAFGILDSDNLEGFQIKNLESMYEDFKIQGKEIGTNSVRVFVGLYKGLPISLDDTFLPKPAVDILIEKGGLSDEQQAFIKSHSVDILNKESLGKLENLENSKAVERPEVTGKIENTAKDQQVETIEITKTNQTVENTSLVKSTVTDKIATSPQTAKTTEEKQEHSEEERVVKGKTTFSEVINWGVEKEKVEEIIRGKIPAMGMTVNDYCKENGIAFSEVKEVLNSLIEK